MSAALLADLAQLLPSDVVGDVTAIEPISMGQSGAGVYAVTSSRGPLILRVNAAGADDARWTQQLVVVRRAAARGVAPAIVHVDEAARAIVAEQVRGAPLAAALADPAQRGPALASVATQLRALHALERDGVGERDPIAFAREHSTAQRARPGFPAWAADLEPLLDELAAILARDPRRVVAHNDVNPGNVLWDGARAWLVDWEVAGLAHPFYDLAALAMFLQLPDEAALGLLALQEQAAIDDGARATFAALRRLAALLCGLVFASLVPDLAALPAAAPTLSDVYGGLRAGTIDLQQPSGRGAFALALLRVGVGDRAAAS